jgi:hypothetical protein
MSGSAKLNELSMLAKAAAVGENWPLPNPKALPKPNPGGMPGPPGRLKGEGNLGDKDPPSRPGRWKFGFWKFEALGGGIIARRLARFSRFDNSLPSPPSAML